MSETLLCIDLQDRFLNQSSRMKKVVENAIYQCELAQRRNDWIIFVEFDETAREFQIHSSKPAGFEPSTKSLLRATKGYKKRIFVFKNGSNGSQEVKLTQKEFNIPFKTVRVCGIYANACVYHTTYSLASYHYKKSTFKIVRNAVSSGANGAIDNDDTLALTKAAPNIRGMGPYLWP